MFTIVFLLVTVHRLVFLLQQQFCKTLPCVERRRDCELQNNQEEKTKAIPDYL